MQILFKFFAPNSECLTKYDTFARIFSIMRATVSSREISRNIWGFETSRFPKIYVEIPGNLFTLARISELLISIIPT